MTTDALKKANRLKRLNPKAWIGYLIGYSSTNIYRIWIPLLNKVISTRDVIFNEEERFTGDLEALKDDVREVDLEELARLLQQVALPDNEQLPKRETPSSYEDTAVIPLDSDKSLNRAEEDALKSIETIKFEPYPTPLATPPAALLAASIQQGEGHTEGTENWLVSTKRHEVWPAAFLAGRLGNAVAKVGNIIYDRAKLQRLLLTPRALHRKNLPPAPTRHDQLQDHPMGHLFEQAEEDHLKSHHEMKSWIEIQRSSIPKKQQILDCI